MASVDRDRLARVLGMMGSSHDGEVLNAAKTAVRLVQEAGLTWQEAIAPDMTSVAVEAARFLAAENDRLREKLARLRARSPAASWREPEDAEDAIDLAIEWTEILTDWEGTFITGLSYRRRLSEKQHDCLARIIRKIKRYARAQGLAA